MLKPLLHGYEYITASQQHSIKEFFKLDPFLPSVPALAEEECGEKGIDEVISDIADNASVDL